MLTTCAIYKKYIHVYYMIMIMYVIFVHQMVCKFTYLKYEVFRWFSFKNLESNSSLILFV
jgi:uncharacterized membrane protein YcaP (DUF421 family)